MPRQFGPHNAIPAARALAAMRSCAACHSPRASPKPAANTTAPPRPRRAQAAMAARWRRAAGQHGGVDAVGQIIDGAQAGAITDVRLVPADQVDGAAIV